ncbi:acyl-CoA dehydrogenase family protein [Dongia deserti]|uniref:acyl-CoA dehydrogenase family protein n=1 Tax=Dongia deserti TaxID=2268030 RepID=UPI002548E7AD|nr:acyl-CoA dehydrogenase family protein [Dongia deserti]
MILTEEQQQIVDMTRDFAESELKSHAEEWEAAGYIPDEIVKKMGELGLMGMLVPEEWGGAGVDYGTYALVVEELAAGDGSVSTLMSVHTSVVCLPILNFGTQAQKERFLRPLATGEMVGAFCLTEPGAGSDAAAIKTRAVREGESYVLNGSKQFISNGKRCGVALVIAVTDPAAGKKGISAFLVPQGTKGFDVARLESKLGQRASDTAQLVFQDCRIPADLRLGAEGEGLKIALANLEGGRIGIAAQAIGMARAAYEAALAYAKERKTFGKTIAEHQAVAFRLADMATQIEAARALTQHACAMRAGGQRALKHAAMAKLFATEMAERVCSDAIQIHGGYGYLKDFGVERIYRDVRVTKIYEGTSDIQKIIISRELLERGA